MRKLVIVNLCVLTVLFLTAGVLAMPDKDDEAVRKLILGRTEILGEYYEGERSFDDARNGLEKVEGGGLLKGDVAAMRENVSSGFEKITGCSIKVLRCERNSHGILVGEAEIQWEQRSFDGRRTVETAEYFFTGEESQRGIKLTQLEIRENRK